MIGPLGLPRPLIVLGTPMAKLQVPPSVETIQEATKQFAPRYDEWMSETHHPIANEIIHRFFYREKHQGRTIAEIGCGTAQLTSNLMCSILLDKIGSLNSGFETTTFICLDQNAEMLALARENVREALIGFMRPLPGARERNPKMKKKPPRDLVIITSDDAVQVAHDGRAIVDVRFLLMAVEGLKGTEYDKKIDLAIMSYINHWLRGLEGKRAAIQTLYDTLCDKGQVFVIEEYPLVVRTDLHTADKDVERLGWLIEEATTVLTIQEILQLYKEAGFVLSGARRIESIDEFHNMHGIPLIKGVYNAEEDRMTKPPGNGKE